MVVEIETETEILADKKTETAKIIERLTKNARKAVKQFESGLVDEAYKKALAEAQKIEDKNTRDFRISLIESEQKKNELKYKAAKEFLQSKTNQQERS
ncbi:MAG TPA: hypothetical protein PK686_02180 [bacterium]|nr:hypothetical protein [bacterium]HPV65469.1 hypothetical protein [bacterium]